MSSILLTAEQIAGLAEIAAKFISLVTEIHTQGAADATQAWQDTVTAFQKAQADWTAAQQRVLPSHATIVSGAPGIASTPDETPTAPGTVAKTERVAKAWST